jgi:hypothetical protein
MRRALLLSFVLLGSFRIDAVNAFARTHGSLSTPLQIATLLLVFGVLLKTAQVPFHGWITAVMEAPTPVSALLHAGVVNVGGFVPMLPDEQFSRFRKQMPAPVCDRDPYGPPRSGIGIPGGSTFESWFYVRRRDEGGHHMTEHYDDDGLAKGE